MEQKRLNMTKGLQSDCHQAPGPLSLYIHIPFCLQKCRYCDFLSGPQSEETREAYVEALLHEIALSGEKCPAADAPGRTETGENTEIGQGCRIVTAPVPGGKDRPKEVDTVFFGGGTPSVLRADQLARILRALHRHFRIREDAEISLEMNPGTADAGKLHDLKAMGINRLSIGVQSMHNRELRLLGRIHTADDAREAYVLARNAGFENVSLDLMSALPGQSFRGWAETLEEAARWEPDHLSAYSLIIEPGTPFAALQETGKLPPLPDEETDREMYHFTRSFLRDKGYQRYEISNYAKPGRACRHNCGYWTGHDWLGMGIGAASCMVGTRFTNIRSLEDYLRIMGQKQIAPVPGQAEAGFDPLESIREDVHRLSLEEQMEEFMFLGLRMTAGVQESVFEGRFGRGMREIYGDILQKHVAQEVLQCTEGGYRLTERGIDVSNYVLADYLLS